MTTKPPHAVDLRDADIVRRATSFTIRRFKGRGTYDRAEATTLADALRIANEWGTDRFGHGPIIYALAPNGDATPIPANYKVTE